MLPLRTEQQMRALGVSGSVFEVVEVLWAVRSLYEIRAAGWPLDAEWARLFPGVTEDSQQIQRKITWKVNLCCQNIHPYY